MKLTIIIILIFIDYCYAQTTSSLIPQEQFRKFQRITVNDGLSQNLVMFVHQDKQGFLWFGSAGGLDRFDGSEIKTYRNIHGLKQQPVYFYSCIENADSTFWIGNEFGLMLFNPVTSSAKMFLPSTPFISSWATNDIHHLTRINDSTIFFGMTGKGLVSFNTYTKLFSSVYNFESYKGRNSGEDIAGIVPLNNKKALLVTYSQIIQIDYTTPEIKHLADIPSGFQARCVLFNKENNSVLIGTTNGIFELKDNIVKPVVLPGISKSKLKSLSVFSMFRDSKNVLWIGTESDGIYSILAGRETIHYINNPLDPKSIIGGPILGFFEDQSENLWISVRDGGLSKMDLKKQKFSVLTNHVGFPKQIINEVIRDIDVDQEDNLWIASNGITYINRSTNKINFYPSLKSLSNSYSGKIDKVYKLEQSFLAIISDRKIYLFNIKTKKLRKLNFTGSGTANIYLAVYCRESGNLLCATPDSLFEIDPVLDKYKKTIINFSVQSIIPNIALVSYLIEDKKGRVWIATNFGVLCWDEAKSSFLSFTDSPGNKVLFRESVITSIGLSETDDIWFGTTSGLFRYNTLTGNTRQYSVKNGLINDKIWSIVVDRDNRVWVTSNKGLMLLKETPNDGLSIRSYTVEDGLPANEFNMNVTATDSKGVFYFGTPNGVVYFHPDSMKDNSKTSPVVLTDLKMYGISTPTESEISYLNKLDIPYENKVFSIKYSSLDFTNSSKNHYMYKLEGYDDRWINAGGRREVFFTNLSPGIYTLLIKSTNGDGVWNEKPLKVTIEIVPPFWMTWWFRGILIIAGIGGIGGSARYLELRKIRRHIETLERQQAVERERSRISKDMHDEIGANLTRISLLSNIITSRSKKEDDVNELNQITGSVNETIEKLDEIVWAVNPLNDNLKNLTSYICEYAQNFFEGSNIRCRFDIAESIPEINLTSEKRHHLFLVIKEAINNVQKYSEAQHVTISLIVEQLFFKFVIKDDGKGFCPESVAAESNGIRNMRERIISIGGKFNLVSSEGEGTDISLKIFI